MAIDNRDRRDTPPDPTPEITELSESEATDRLIRAEGELLDLGDPIPAKRGQPKLSQVLESMRRGER